MSFQDLTVRLTSVTTERADQQCFVTIDFGGIGWHY